MLLVSSVMTVSLQVARAARMLAAIQHCSASGVRRCCTAAVVIGTATLSFLLHVLQDASALVCGCSCWSPGLHYRRAIPTGLRSLAQQLVVQLAHALLQQQELRSSEAEAVDTRTYTGVAAQKAECRRICPVADAACSRAAAAITC